MPDAQDQHALLGFIIHDDMRLERMRAHRRVDLFTQPGGARRLGKECKGPLQAIVIPIGLNRAEPLQAIQIDCNQVMRCRPREPVRRHVRA